MQLFLEEICERRCRPDLAQKSTSRYADFSENLIASRVAKQLLENISMVFIFNLSLHGTTEQKIKQIEVSFEPETRSSRNAKYYNVSQTNYSTEISPYFPMGYKFKCHKNTVFLRVTIHPPKIPLGKWCSVSCLDLCFS